MDPDEEDRLLAEADARRARSASLRQSVTQEQAQQAVALIRRNPNLSAGLLQALVQGQVPDEEADRLAAEDDGGILGSIGDFAGGVIEAVTDGAEWALDKTYEYGIKPVVRGAFTIADSLAQELVQRPLTAGLAAAQGEASSFGQAYKEYGDSAGLNLLQGDYERVDENGEPVSSLGTGLFAGGAAQAQSDAERTLTIRGRRADVGQAIANSTVGYFSAPGEKAYNTVAGISGFAVEVFGDPLAWATGGASKVVQASRRLDPAAAKALLEGAGAISSGRRLTVIPDKARNFVGNGKMLERLAQADAYDIYQMWSGSPAHRIDHDVIRQLGEASTEADVLDVLVNAIATGQGPQSKGFYSGMGHFVKRSLVTSESRLAAPLRFFTPEGKLSGIAPRGVISADDVGDAAEKLDSLLRQANIGREKRAEIFNRTLSVEAGAFDDLFQVTVDALNEVGAKVGDRGVGVELSDLAAQYKQELLDIRHYGVDSAGNSIDMPFAKTFDVTDFDGNTVKVAFPTPQMTSELNSLALTLPEVTDIRRAATDSAVMRAVYTSKGWDLTASAMTGLTRQVFKPLAILRPAYIVRIGMEEQARLQAAFGESVYSHPGRFIMANILNRKAMSDLVGNDATDVARSLDVISKDATGVLADSRRGKARLFKRITRGDGDEISAEFARAWRVELGQIAAAEEARMLTHLRGDLDQFKVWAQGDGLEHIERLAKQSDEAGSLLEFGDDFDKWADGLRRRIEAKTGGWDEDLVDRIANRDIPYKETRWKDGKPVGDTSEAAFANVLRAKARAGRAPAMLKSEVLEEGLRKTRTRFVDTLFDYIAGKPTSYLARYPAWRMSMLDRTGDLFESLADDALRKEAFAAAVENLGAGAGRVIRQSDTPELARLRAKFDASLGKPGGPIGELRQLNDIVTSRSAQDVKDLLFDVTRRGAGQDAMEAVVPFLDAWKEVTVTWGRLVKENPAFFMRAAAGYREMGDQGHFYVNDFGDEVFAYPGGGFLSSFVRRMNEAGGDVLTDTIPALGGALADTVTGNTPDYGVRLEGRVQGLNLVAQGVGPGFGPVVQWGAGMFTSPDLDGFREFLAPFGTGLSEPGDVTDPGVLAEGLMPAWARKLTNALRDGAVDERQWNSTVGDAMKALAASGDYPPEDTDRLLEDAERFGKWLLIARGVTQGVGPTGPSATLETPLENVNRQHEDWNPDIDPEGHWFSIGVLAEDYYRLLNTYGPDVAAGKFYEMYGAEPFFIAQAKTRSLTAAPVTTEGDRWMRRNEGVVEDYRVVAGYFAPSDEDADLDFSVYTAQMARGDRQSLTPRQQVALASQVRARSMYQAVKDRVQGLPKPQRDRALELVKARLESLYPGWQSDVLGVQKGAKTADKIRELQRAVADERLADEPLTVPLAAYLAVRDKMLAEAQARGLKTLSSDRVSDLRDLLRQAGMAVQAAFPAFSGVWSEVLSRELED